MNVLELLDSHNIIYTTGHRDVRQGWVGLPCPWCGNRGGELYLAVNISSGACTCWRCGRHSLVDVLVAVGNVPLAKAVPAARNVERAVAASRPPGKLTRPSGVEPLGGAHAGYLRKRGWVPAELEALWGLQGIGLAAKLPWRIYIPIFDVNGWEVSWTTRAIGANAVPRYRGAAPHEEAVSAKILLYGEQYARPHSIIVHEGPADVWATGPGAVATLGLSVSIKQVMRIASYWRRVIMFDAEPEAQRRAVALAERLLPYPGETIVAELQTGNDAPVAEHWELNEARQFLE